MVNLEHKLMVDDLIVEYMIYKVENGYEPSFLISEFMDFLCFFESKMPANDKLSEGDKLFERFFERKNERDWTSFAILDEDKQKTVPHMEMHYSDIHEENLIKANYKLSDYDASVINTYFMDRKKRSEIKKIIEVWFADFPKREISVPLQMDKSSLLVGKHVSAEIARNIWLNHIGKQVEKFYWPEQCVDMNEYLFDINLAEIINVKSIKDELIELYACFSERITSLYSQDENLQISTFKNKYLAYANYELLVRGYENMVRGTFGAYKKSLEIDLSASEFKDEQKIDTGNVIINSSIVNNENVKRLVKNFDKCIE